MKVIAILLCSVVLAWSVIAVAQSPVKFPESAENFRRPPNLKQTLLFRPRDGAGPFPAVILMHTCGGVGAHIYDWAERLTRAGYVALVLDVFSPRGIKNNCNKPAWQADVSLDAANGDAIAAIAHLRKLPIIDADRIGIAGFSFGAIAAIKLGNEAYRNRLGGAPGLKAIAFFYGSCATPSPNAQARAAYEWPADIGIPVMAFLGGIDNDTPAQPCAEAAERLRVAGAPVAYKIYPETTHAFDEPAYGTIGRNIMAGTRGPFLYRYNPDATEDAWREMKVLFDRELKGVK